MENKDTTKSLVLMNREISKELSDPAVGRALLATTFKGLSEPSMRQAIFEGMMRNFKFKDFLEKNVYAVPYGSGYSLVTSIDYSRKIGASAGICGEDDPIYGEDPDLPGLPGGTFCKKTVYKLIEKVARPFTSKVYLKEYSTGKNLWNTKPRTMIAKVAEMHALRMACPEELSQVYTEDELDKDKGEEYDREEIADDAVPTVHIGDDHGIPTPSLTMDRPKEDQEIPDDEIAQKNLIIAKAKVKWPDLDIRDAKAVKLQIVDYAELEFVPKNYQTLIKKLS